MKRFLSLILTISIIASLFVFVMPAYASDTTEPFIEYIVDDDFSSADDLKNYRSGSSHRFTSETESFEVYDSVNKVFKYPTVHSLDNGVFKTVVAPEALGYETSRDRGVIHNGFQTSLITGKPKLVFSYRVKLDFKEKNAAYGFGTIKSGVFTAINTVFFDGAGTMYPDVDKGSSIGSYTQNEWVTVSMVYDNDATNLKDKRDIYINGEYKGTYESEANNGNGYVNTGKVFFYPRIYQTKDSSVAFDDIMIYAYPTELKYEFAGASANEVKLNFNMIPDKATLNTSNFTVKNGDAEIKPTSVALSEADPRQVILTFANNFTPYVNYTVSATGITAGSGETDVAGTLNLSENPELAFSVTAGASEWANTNEFYPFNYEGKSTDMTIAADSGSYESSLGIYRTGNGGVYAIETDGTNEFVTVKQSDADNGNAHIYILPRKENFASGKAYAFETRIKFDAFGDLTDTMFDVRPGTYGMNFLAIYNGEIYSNSSLTGDVIGTYKNNEWITLKNVYYSSPVTIDDAEYLRRDIYINGQFVKTVYDSWNDFGKYVNGTDNGRLTLRIRKRYDILDKDAKLSIDYIRVYETGSSFAAKLETAQKESANTDYINVLFNNTPAEAELFNKVYVADENGAKVSDIVVPEFINEFNASGYATKANLYFENQLEYGKNYKLCIMGLSDVLGNTLYHEETFTTKATPEAEELKFNPDTARASVKINEYTEPLILVAAMYEKDEKNVLKLVQVQQKEITSEGTFETEEINCAGLDGLVKVYLLKGSEIVIPSVSLSI